MRSSSMNFQETYFNIPLCNVLRQPKSVVEVIQVFCSVTPQLKILVRGQVYRHIWITYTSFYNYFICTYLEAALGI